MKNILVFLGALMLTGCSSIIAGSTRVVEINSTPSNQYVEILNHKGDPIDSGITPFTVKLKRGRGYFQASDYSLRAGDHTEPINYGLTPWYVVGNFVFGGLIGWVVVDPATGAMFDMPGKITLDLTAPEPVLNYSPDRSTKAHEIPADISPQNNAPQYRYINGRWFDADGNLYSPD